MNREFFVKLFGIPKECQRDGSYKSLGRFFKTEIITRKNLDAMYQHLDKTYQGDVRCSSRYGVMKAFLGYGMCHPSWRMTTENMTYISGRAGRWGDDPTGESRHAGMVMAPFAPGSVVPLKSDEHPPEAS